MSRKLSPYEAVLWLFGRDEPFLVQWTLFITGNIDTASVEKALRLVQQQHPLLNHTVSQTQPFTFEPVTKPIRLTKHVRNTDKSWEKIATHLLSLPQPLATDETFLSLDWVSDGSEHEFIFTMDHAFSDLRCLTGIGRDFLKYLNEVLNHDVNIKVQYYPFLPATDTILPDVKKPAPVPEYTVPWGDETPIAKTSGQYHLLHLQTFSEEETAKINAFARQHECTVHSLLCTAMSMALNEHLLAMGKSGETFAFTPADLRPYLNAKISGKELGNFASGIFHPFKIGQLPSFLTQAQKIAHQVIDAYENDNSKNGVLGFQSMYREGMSAKEVVKLIKIREGAAGISNVGAIPFPEYAHFTVKGARIGSASPIMSGREHLFWIGVETIHNRLQLEFVKLDTHAPGTVETFSERVVAILKEHVL